MHRFLTEQARPHRACRQKESLFRIRLRARAAPEPTVQHVSMLLVLYLGLASVLLERAGSGCRTSHRRSAGRSWDATMSPAMKYSVRMRTMSWIERRGAEGQSDSEA